MREIEIKIKLDKKNKSVLEKWLGTNAKFIKELKHKEFYLNNPERTFFYTAKAGYKDAKDYMRVRFTEKGDSVCIKRFEINYETGKAKNIDEIEYNVSDGNEALKLFKSIGFTDNTELSKQRKVYEYRNFEIVMDRIKGLGDFAEVEIKNFPEEKDFKEGVDAIRDFIQKVGIKKYRECFRGYVSMIWNPDMDFTEEKILN